LTGGFDAAMGDWNNVWDAHPAHAARVSAAFQEPQDSLASLLRRPPISSCIVVRRNLQLWWESAVPWEVFDYFLSLLAEGFSIVHVPHVIAHIRQHDSPERLSIATNHFEPYRTGRLYSDFKHRLAQRQCLTAKRREMADQKILSS